MIVKVIKELGRRMDTRLRQKGPEPRWSLECHRHMSASPEEVVWSYHFKKDGSWGRKDSRAPDRPGFVVNELP